MIRRAPPLRTPAQRTSDNDKRRLRQPRPPTDWLRALADRASFEGYSKHKLQPRAFGLEPFSGQHEDTTYCDAHAGYTPADMARALPLLRRGILAGLVGENSIQGDPTILWTVDDNGWIYEARITVPGRARYHGYPVLRSEAIARIVIARFVQYAYDDGSEDLRRHAQQVQGRYA